MKRNPVAIIGIAGRFPTAADIQDFFQALAEGRDCVRPLDQRRICDLTMPLNPLPYQEMGWLADADKFDHKYFNIALREAEQMDPHQRLMMEVSMECFESAGLSLADISGTRTGIIATNGDYTYWHHFEFYEPTMMTGNMAFSAPGRMSRFFNTTGPGFILDTGCSSTLMAVDLAMDQLALENYDQVLIAGSRLILEPPTQDGQAEARLESQDGRTRSFSANSAGYGNAEAVVSMLFKPLDRALADGDPIYAVILASASNSNAQTSGSLTATSATAQSRLYQLAWQRAGIDPLTLRYIEAHGSATPLGDPIEISGIDQAYKGLTDRRHFISVSSVKSNIAHADKLAGFAGLTKAVLSLHHRTLFPNLHFHTPNPFIDFASSVTRIQTETQAWEAESGIPRRCGVSSFGFAGNNVHVLLEEAPVRAALPPTPDTAWLFPVSSRRPAGVHANMRALLAYLETHGADLHPADVSATLLRGRTHHRCRTAFTASSLEDLMAQLRTALAQPETAHRQGDPLKKQIMLFSDCPAIPPGLAQQFCTRYPDFRTAWDSILNAGGGADSAGLQALAFQYGFYHWVQALGMASQDLLGTGLGDVCVKLILQQMSLEEAVAAALLRQDAGAPIPAARLEALVDRECSRDKIVFLECGPAGALSQGLQALSLPDQEHLYTVITLTAGPQAAQQWMQARFLEYAPMDVHAWNRLHPGQRIWLPAYQFEKTRVWIKPATPDTVYAAWQQQVQGGTPAVAETATVNTQEVSQLSPLAFTVDETWTPVQQQVGRIWKEVLRREEIALDDDFFSIGGHSLFGTMVTNRIEQEFGIRLVFRNILTFSTVRSLAAGIEDILAGKAALGHLPPIEALPAAPHYPVSHAQRRLWIVQQMDPQHVAYNLPGMMPLSPDMDADALEAAFRALIARHESLRTVFREAAGEAVQVILPEQAFTLHRTDLRQHADPQAALHKAWMQEVFTPFDLTQGPLLRAEMVQVRDTECLLLYNIHHIISDTWSMNVMIRELLQYYGAFRAGQTLELPPLAVHYKDFAHWHNALVQGPEGDKQYRYWAEKLSGAALVPSLPLDHARPLIPVQHGQSLVLNLDAQARAALETLASRAQGTLFMSFMSLWKALIYKYTAHAEVRIGTPAAGRDMRELEGQIGFYVNTLVLRDILTAEETFDSLQQKVKQTAAEALENQYYPFEMLVEKLKPAREPGRLPYFDVFVTFNAAGSYDGELGAEPDLHAGIHPGDAVITRFDLEVNAFEYPNGIQVSFTWNTSLFEEATAYRFLQDFRKLLDIVSQQPEISLRDIVLADADSRAQVQESIQQNAELNIEFDF